MTTPENLEGTPREHGYSMIMSADRIVIDGTTGWLVTDLPGHFTILDRPCWNCEGQHDGTRETYCPDCIDGRHTFDLSVECGKEYPWGTLNYRVSIVRVLPIHEDADDNPNMIEMVTLSPNGHAEYWDHNEVEQGIPITLPSAAAPGMFAVGLRVARPAG
jgi:hypothetical protein